MLIPKPNLKIAIDYCRRCLINSGQVREKKSWHSIESTYQMREVNGVSFKSPIITRPYAYYISDMEYIQALIRPNIPWADNHFMERVGGVPLNPGNEYKNWPFYKQDEKVRNEGEKFSHTYMERYWPKFANRDLNHEHLELMGGNKHWGIRYEYGDLMDVINLLDKDPNTRQAFLPVWFPEDTGAVHGKRVPCSLGYLFEQVDGYLHITYYMRSCDYLRHLRDDIYLTVRLLIWVLTKLQEKNNLTWGDIELGYLTMHIANLHIFSHELKILENEQQTNTTGIIPAYS